MPQKKITDLTELTSVANGDWVLVVDVSDTTDSAEGTSKKVQANNLPGGGGGSGDEWGDPVDANIVPDADGTRDLGSSANRFANVHADSLDLAGSTAVTSVLDEDDMSSDSATALATQQSIKAYIDANSGGGDAANANFIVAASDEDTYLATGAAKVTFPWPYSSKTITRVRVSVSQAPTGSGNLTVDVNDDGTSILSSPISITATNKSANTTSFAGATPVKDSEMTIDIDAVTATLTGKGLKVQFDFD